ncbi:alpha/beta-type small acid-soluble spore protein [Intestinimonas butyriciproducens]|uniref:alpha/beta-type small acid-soluble spore protein n=1 Tax=Intestinimonas butyriciproducens TaxID=1297617 RepID=UPI00321C28B2
MSSSNNSNQPVVPSAREALNKFKMEAAQEVGVNLKQGYNGDLTSREAGSVGGQMVKKMGTVRTTKYIRADRTAMGHEIEVRYIAGITV